MIFLIMITVYFNLINNCNNNCLVLTEFKLQFELMDTMTCNSSDSNPLSTD